MLYLVQHAEAKNADEDPLRDLSETGVEHARRAGDFLAAHGIRELTIWHSGKLRAEHTARIIAESIGGGRLSEHEGLNPNDDPERVADEVNSFREGDLMIVGHQPFLGRLGSVLLETAGGRPPLQFRNAGVVALLRAEGVWVLEWSVPPQLMHKEHRDR